MNFLTIITIITATGTAGVITCAPVDGAIAVIGMFSGVTENLTGPAVQL